MAESPTPFAEIDLGPSKLDQFLDAHQKKLIIAAILLALGLIAYVIYSGIAKGEAEDAGAALLKAEKIEDYQELIKQWPNSQSATTALPLLADLQGEKSPEDAIQTLRDFIDANTDHPAVATAKVSLALRLLEQKNTDEAITILTDVSENDSDTYIAPLACISLGDIAKAAGKKDEAKTWYEKAQAEAPEQGSPYGDAATARLSLVYATPPKKIQPVPPAPALPPVPAPSGLPPVPVPAPPAITPAITPEPAPPVTPPVTPPTPPEPTTDTPENAAPTAP